MSILRYSLSSNLLTFLVNFAKTVKFGYMGTISYFSVLIKKTMQPIQQLEVEMMGAQFGLEHRLSDTQIYTFEGGATQTFLFYENYFRSISKFNAKVKETVFNEMIQQAEEVELPYSFDDDAFIYKEAITAVQRVYSPDHECHLVIIHADLIKQEVYFQDADTAYDFIDFINSWKFEKAH